MKGRREVALAQNSTMFTMATGCDLNLHFDFHGGTLLNAMSIL